MRRATLFAALAFALGLAATGCGTATPTGASGRSLFAQACGFCHSLTGHESPSKQGGDLLGVRLRRPVALQFAREMPVRPRLSHAELAAIVDYIALVQRRG
ncbi:MAG: c-type cytochrome [Solirubrobacteraceae bacterium]